MAWFLRCAGRGWADSGQPRAGSAAAQAAPPPAQGAAGGPGRAAGRWSGGGRAGFHRQPRSGHGRTLLFQRVAPVGTDGAGPPLVAGISGRSPFVGLAGPSGGRGAGAGQGRKASHGAGRPCGTGCAGCLAGDSRRVAGGASGSRYGAAFPVAAGAAAEQPLGTTADGCAGPATGPATARPSARAATFVCQPHAAVLGRPAGRAGAAGTRQHRHYPGVHGPGFPAPGGRL